MEVALAGAGLLYTGRLAFSYRRVKSASFDGGASAPPFFFFFFFFFKGMHLRHDTGSLWLCPFGCGPTRCEYTGIGNSITTSSRTLSHLDSRHFLVN